jgi:hypothetical protein
VSSIASTSQSFHLSFKFPAKGVQLAGRHGNAQEETMSEADRQLYPSLELTEDGFCSIVHDVKRDHSKHIGQARISPYLSLSKVTSILK